MLAVSEEVRMALEEGRPVVALESTVICHGLPYPENASAALRIEHAVREGGAVPATIGIEDGRFVVGMEEDVERFATAPGVPKVSGRDVAVVMAGGGMGATTVASTLIAADAAGIPFFSTAGIGGVHRGAGETFDVSADLVQFTRSKVAVVCAGAKSILDLGLTLEYLETLGVPVVAEVLDRTYEESVPDIGHRVTIEGWGSCEVIYRWRCNPVGCIVYLRPTVEERTVGAS